MRKKKKEVISKNYLLRIPVRPCGLNWTADDEGIVTLEIENKGFLKRITQLLLGKPKISYIHLDKHGSFAWMQVDGVKDITAIGELVEAQFGEESHPLYERLAKFFQILDSYHFIEWIGDDTDKK